jgi:hypothetical protein
VKGTGATGISGSTASGNSVGSVSIASTGGLK